MVAFQFQNADINGQVTADMRISDEETEKTVIERRINLSSEADCRDAAVAVCRKMGLSASSSAQMIDSIQTVLIGKGEEAQRTGTLDNSPTKAERAEAEGRPVETPSIEGVSQNIAFPIDLEISDPADAGAVIATVRALDGITGTILHEARIGLFADDQILEFATTAAIKAHDPSAVEGICRTISGPGVAAVLSGEKLVRFDTGEIQKHRKPAAAAGHMTARQLIAAHPALSPYVVDGVCREGEVINVVGASKSRKSWLVLMLAICIAAGRPWMSFKVSKGKVLLIDNELPPSIIAFRLKEIARAMALPDDEWIDSIHIQSYRGRDCNVLKMGSMFSDIRPGAYKAVILDALYRSFPADAEKDAGIMTEAYSALQRYATMIGAALFGVHHSSKGNQSDKSVVDMGSGSGVQSRFADGHIAVREHEEADCAVFDGVLRSFAPFPKFGARWRFPLWEYDPTLDPEKIKRERGRGGRPKKDAAKADETPTAPEWTAERFVAEFVGTAPSARDAIQSKATRGGISFRAVGGFIAEAEEAGLIFEHRKEGFKGKFYSTVNPQSGECAQLISHTHTPPTPPVPRAKAPRKRRN
jgi:hypothetical protein